MIMAPKGAFSILSLAEDYREVNNLMGALFAVQTEFSQNIFAVFCHLFFSISLCTIIFSQKHEILLQISKFSLEKM